MSWEWSHTNEAYDNFRKNVEDLPLKELRVIWSEWQALISREDDPGAFDEDAYRLALADAMGMPGDILAANIAERAEELRTCENGGHLAWACPFGCGCHLVSFEREEDDNDSN